MSDTELAILSSAFADKMRRVGMDALYAKGIKKEDLDIDLLVKLFREAATPALDEALADARQAVEAGMRGWADATFMASAGKWGAIVAKKYLEAKK